MQRTTTVRSWGAIALGAACAIGTLIVLFGHVRALDDLTPYHLGILLALAVAYGAGHFMWDAFGEGVPGVLRGIAFTVLFGVATVICVGLSGGRSAAVLEGNENAASHHSAARLNQEGKMLAARRDAEEAKERADKAQGDADASARAQLAECGTGKGGEAKEFRCDGKTKAAETAAARAATFYKRFEQTDALYRIELVRLEQFTPPQVANRELKQLAKVWAHVRGVTEAQAMASVLLLLPYSMALLTEFGSIVFFKHGFGRRRVRDGPETGKAAAETVNRRREPSRTEQVKHAPMAKILRFTRRRERFTSSQALADLLAYSRSHGEAPSQDFLAARWRWAKSTVSKWLKVWEEEGRIVRRSDGRFKVVESA